MPASWQVQYKKQTAAFNAEQLCSFVLKDLKGTAEVQPAPHAPRTPPCPCACFLQLSPNPCALSQAMVHSPVKNCTLAAPSYFTDKQRASLAEAATLAGLTCVRVISEPVAAAIAYGLDKCAACSRFFPLSSSLADLMSPQLCSCLAALAVTESPS